MLCIITFWSHHPTTHLLDHNAFRVPYLIHYKFQFLPIVTKTHFKIKKNIMTSIVYPCFSCHVNNYPVLLLLKHYYMLIIYEST